MEPVVRTVSGSEIQSSQQLGLNYVAKQYTTLNEKFGIQASSVVAPGTYPRVRYYCIGFGGHKLTVGADSTPLVDFYQHKATDTALFKHLPFVLRPVANDLSTAERAKYALRREETHDGALYVAYYLKRVDLNATFVQVEYRSVNNGVTTSTPYVPTAAALEPTPTVINNNGVNTVSGDYITSSARLSLDFTASEITEIINAATIIYGDEKYAIISEIGLCAATDKTVSVSPSTGGSFNFNEAIGVQIVSFVSSFHVAKYTTSGLSKTLDLGINDSLFNIT